MKYKYQLIVLGKLGSLSNKVIDLFYKKIVELKLERDYFKIINHGNFNTEYNGNQPAFAIYFGDENGSFKDVTITENLIKDGTLILPVYYTENCFSNEIPKILENQNGLLYDASKDIKIVNLVLEAFELLR